MDLMEHYYQMEVFDPMGFLVLLKLVCYCLLFDNEESESRVAMV